MIVFATLRCDYLVVLSISCKFLYLLLQFSVNKYYVFLRSVIVKYLNLHEYHGKNNISTKRFKNTVQKFSLVQVWRLYIFPLLISGKCEDYIQQRDCSNMCVTLQHLNAWLSLFDRVTAFSVDDPGHC